MDSLSQIALGSAVGMAVMGRRTKLWKAALVGAVYGTLPDLDAFIDYGDPVRNVTFHRAQSHALFYLILASPLLAWLAAKLFGEMKHFKHWLLATALILITHALLDYLTIYGTQLALPFTDTPFGLGSIFIIDPLYTLPLLIGIIGALILQKRPAGLRWNNIALAVSTFYLAWGIGAQQYVKDVARDAVAAKGWSNAELVVTATPFNTLLWRVLVLTPDGYAEGFYSLLDRARQIDFNDYDRGKDLLPAVRGNWEAERVIWFSHGFYKLGEEQNQLVISDLRMGQEPFYSFNFILAQRVDDEWVFIEPELDSRRPDIGIALAWIWQRMRGERLAPPWL